MNKNKKEKILLLFFSESCRTSYFNITAGTALKAAI